ncbi:MAG: zinc ribbon domain-containing protein, partial [Deltaproteobacteria bacterium]
MVEMSACQKCGYQCADEEKYCSKCGCQLTNTVNPMKKTKQSKTMIFYKLLLGYGIFMILIIIGSISWSENNKKGIASLLFHLALVIISIFLIKKTKSKSTNVIQDKTQNDRDITSSQSIYDDSVPTNQVDPKYAKFIKQRLALYKFLFGFGIFMILMGYAGISGAWEEKGIAIFAIISGLACMCLAIILISITKSKSINVAVYKPKKGFYFYRISTEQRIKFYKRLRIFLSIILLSAAGFLYIKKIWGKEVLNVNFFRNVSDVV